MSTTLGKRLRLNHFIERSDAATHHVGLTGAATPISTDEHALSRPIKRVLVACGEHCCKWNGYFLTVHTTSSMLLISCIMMLL